MVKQRLLRALPVVAIVVLAACTPPSENPGAQAGGTASPSPAPTMPPVTLSAEPMDTPATLTPGPLAEPSATPGVPTPPPASLEIGGQQQPAGIGTYCWPADDPASAAPGLCLDAVGIPTAQDPLVVPAGPFTATFQLNGPGQPAELLLTVARVDPGEQMHVASDLRYWPPHEGERYNLPLGSTPAVELDLEPGLYVLDLFARWEGRDVSYGFLVQVE